MFIQNTANKAKNAWARFGDKSARSHLMLHAGHYAIKYKACNWNCPEFSPITVAVETTSGEEVASQTYTPTVNIGGNVANKFTGVTQQTFEFDIPETGDYVLVFYADAAKNSDFVLGQAIIQAIKYTETTGIQDVQQRSAAQPSAARGCFDLLGRRLPNENLKPGLYVIDGRKVVIK